MHHITKQKIEALRREFEEAAEEIAKRHGVAITMGRATYGETGTLKVEVAALTESGEAISQERLAWEQFAKAGILKMEDVDPDWLDKEFLAGDGKRHRVTGFNARAKKFPICTKADDGKSYKWAVRSIAQAFAFEARRKAAR